MRIYIVEDDTSVIGILEDIVEGNELGVVCGDSGGEPANLGQILALDPDLVLVDLLMPQKDGIQVVRELKEQGCRAKFIMISQVSNKEMVAKAYLAGVDFFINKPINLIEVRQVILNVRRQLEPRAMQNLFRVGYSTKFNPETGNISRGIGLPAVEFMVQELGGTIQVDSGPGTVPGGTDATGACFRVTIPRTAMEKGAV